jgi:hypothetical protein
MSDRTPLETNESTTEVGISFGTIVVIWAFLVLLGALIGLVTR